MMRFRAMKSIFTALCITLIFAVMTKRNGKTLDNGHVIYSAGTKIRYTHDCKN